MVHADSERLGVGLLVVDGDVDLQRAEGRAAEPLGHFQRIGVRTAVDVEPSGSLFAEEVGRLDDQFIAFPPAARVAEPPWLRVVVGCGPSIRVDVSQAVVRLVGDQRQILRLHDLPRLRMIVILHQADRQAPHVGVVLAVVGHALLLQLSGPRLQRQRGSTAGDLEELRVGNGIRIGRCRRRSGSRTSPAATASAKPTELPDTGEIGLAFRRSRRRAVQNRLAVFPGHIGRGIRRPLGAERRRQGHTDCEHTNRRHPPGHSRTSC